MNGHPSSDRAPARALSETKADMAGDQRTRPSLFVLDGSGGRTGALIAANRAALLLSEDVASTLVFPEGVEIPPQAVSGFDRVIRLPMVHIRKSLASLVRYVPALIHSTLKLRRAMRGADCQRLQINDFHLLQGALLRLIGYRGLLITCIRVDPRRFGVLGRLWVTAAMRSSDWVVVPSRFIERVIPPARHVRVVYDAFRAEGEPPRAAPGSPRRFVFVGNYIEGKGQDIAIEAFERIAERFPDAELCFFGGDMGLAKNREYKEALQRRAATGPASDRIRFGGAIEDLGEAYRSAFAAVNCSRSESFSLTCQEASAHGVPVIATRSGGPEEIIEEGKTGFLVPVDDAEAVADRMVRLLEQPAHAAEMGSNGRKLVATKFAPEDLRSQMRDMLGLER